MNIKNLYLLLLLTNCKPSNQSSSKVSTANSANVNSMNFTSSDLDLLGSISAEKVAEIAFFFDFSESIAANLQTMGIVPPTLYFDDAIIPKVKTFVSPNNEYATMNVVETFQELVKLENYSVSIRPGNEQNSTYHEIRMSHAAQTIVTNMIKSVSFALPGHSPIKGCKSVLQIDEESQTLFCKEGDMGEMPGGIVMGAILVSSNSGKNCQIGLTEDLYSGKQKEWKGCLKKEFNDKLVTKIVESYKAKNLKQ